MVAGFLSPVFEALGPEWFWVPLIVAAVLFGGLAVLVYRTVSNQAGIRLAKDRMRSAVLAIRLFSDEPVVIARSLGSVAVCSLGMLRFSLVPLLVMAGPFVLLMAALWPWYEYRPLRAGETAVFQVQLDGGERVGDAIGTGRVVASAAGVGYATRRAKDPSREKVMDGIVLEGDQNIAVETPAVRIVSEGVVAWRVRAMGSGLGVLRLRGPSGLVREAVPVDSFAGVVTREWVAKGKSADEGNGSKTKDAMGASIVDASASLSLPRRTGWLTGSGNWYLWLIGVSIASGCVLKRWAGVEM